MNRVIKKPEAERDLYGIWNYVAKHNIESAHGVIEGIDEIFNKLTSHPNMGRIRSELGKGVRSFPVSSWVIFYKHHEDKKKVEIIRVLHGSQDVEEEMD